MAREAVEYPAGVSQSVFSAHTHKYRKITQLGVDQSSGWTNPSITDIVDDSLVTAEDGTDLEGVGIAVATSETEAPS